MTWQTLLQFYLPSLFKYFSPKKSLRMMMAEAHPLLSKSWSSTLMKNCPMGINGVMQHVALLHLLVGFNFSETHEAWLHAGMFLLLRLGQVA
jgi:hypothetical protein